MRVNGMWSLWQDMGLALLQEKATLRSKQGSQHTFAGAFMQCRASDPHRKLCSNAYLLLWYKNKEYNDLNFSWKRGCPEIRPLGSWFLLKIGHFGARSMIRTNYYHFCLIVIGKLKSNWHMKVYDLLDTRKRTNTKRISFRLPIATRCCRLIETTQELIFLWALDVCVTYLSSLVEAI